MTKFMNFNSDRVTSKNRNTKFKYEIGWSNGTPVIEAPNNSPKEFENVMHLYYDNILKLDVFMAWNNDITRAYIYYGTKGDEFE